MKGHSKFPSAFREAGLSKLVAPEHQGLIAPPLEGDSYQFQMRSSIKNKVKGAEMIFFLQASVINCSILPPPHINRHPPFLPKSA
jgi:hypothetical protein